jgi:hypothetical protein
MKATVAKLTLPRSFVLAATEHLHRRIAKLSGRIRQLEDALAALQAQHSTEPHPLLHEDLVNGEDKDEEGASGHLAPDTSMVDDPDGSPGTGTHADVIDALGTLSISDHGISRFFGPTGGSEVRILNYMSIPTISIKLPSFLPRAC